MPGGTAQAKPLPPVQSTVSQGGEWWLVLSVGVDYRVALLDPQSQVVPCVVELALRAVEPASNGGEPASNAAADEENVVERRSSVFRRILQATRPSTVAVPASAAVSTPRPDRVPQPQVEEMVLHAASTQAALAPEGGAGGPGQGTRRGRVVAWAFDGRRRANATQPSELTLELTPMLANGHVRPISNNAMRDLQSRAVPVVEMPCVATPRPPVEASTGAACTDSSPTEVAPGVPGAVTAREATPVIPTGVVALNCGHALHEECIRRWLERSAHCPLCREAVRGRRQLLQGLL